MDMNTNSVVQQAIHFGQTSFLTPIADANQDLPSLSATVMTLAEHDAVFKKVVAGEILVEAVRESYERLIRDKEEIKAELKKLKVKDLEKFANPRYRGEKKDRLVEAVMDAKLTDYGFLTAKDGILSISGYEFEERAAGIRARLAAMSENDLAHYRDQANAALERRRQRVQEYTKALSNPETLEEFDVFLKLRGDEKLTPEQRTKRDELVAAKLKDEAEQKLAQRATVGGVDVNTELRLVETKHTRDDYDLFVVQLANRVDSEKFKELSVAAKRLSGWYSSYSKDGAVPGFQFKVRTDAEQFMAIGRGEAVDTTKRIEQRKAESREGAVDRLRSMADRLEDAGSAKLNQDRKTNTARRARMASSAESAARADIALARTMRNLADAIGAGNAKHLEGLREKAQVELLTSILTIAKSAEISATTNGYAESERRKGEPETDATIQYVSFPKYTGYGDDLSRLAQTLSTRPGMIRLADRIRVLGNAASKEGKSVDVPVDLVDILFDKLGSAVEQVLPYFWVSANAKLKRLARMGITGPEQLRLACREYLAYREKKAVASKAVELERALVGKKVGIDFFPTPKQLAARMVEMAGIRPGHRCLEPSAGNGNIAEAIRAAGVEPDVVEISSQLREILLAKGFNVVGWDFLDVKTTYQIVIMNPPFGNCSDIHHVRHAYSLLEEGGRLVAIVGEGAFFRSRNTEREFCEWLDELGAEVEKLPPGTFTDHSLMATTGTNARLVRIVK